MALMRGVLIRDVSLEECPWLDLPIRLGTHVFRFDGVTYGTIAPWGVACSWNGDNPFFELPSDAVAWEMS